MIFDHERALVDPEGKYPSDGLRSCERLALRVLRRLRRAEVERARDVIQISYGGEEGVVVLATAEAIEIRLPTVEWTRGAYGPAASSVLWKRIKASEDTPSDEELDALLDKGIRARRRQFEKCVFCGKRVPHEHMTDDACHGCASKHRGIVY